MSANTIYAAANDPALIKRVTAMAQKEIQSNEDLAATSYGKELLRGSTNVAPLMFPVAVSTEAAYEAALLNGRGAPGHDEDVITDAALTAAIVAGWPPDTSFTPVPNLPTP